MWLVMPLTDKGAQDQQKALRQINSILDLLILNVCETAECRHLVHNGTHGSRAQKTLQDG